MYHVLLSLCHPPCTSFPNPSAYLVLFLTGISQATAFTKGCEVLEPAENSTGMPWWRHLLAILGAFFLPTSAISFIHSLRPHHMSLRSGSVSLTSESPVASTTPARSNSWTDWTEYNYSSGRTVDLDVTWGDFFSISCSIYDFFHL